MTGIEGQIEEGFTQLRTVAGDEGQRAGTPVLQVNGAPRRLRLDERQHFVDEIREGHEIAGERLRADEAEKSLDDLIEPLDLSGDDRHVPGNGCRRSGVIRLGGTGGDRGLRARPARMAPAHRLETEHRPHGPVGGKRFVRRVRPQLLLQQLEVDGHGVQRVLDLMRNAAEQPSQGRHLGRRLDARGPRVRVQPRADGLERPLQRREFVSARQVERHVGLTVTEAGQPGPDDMDGLDDSLRKGDRHEQCNPQRRHEGGGSGAHRLLQLVTNEHGGETDPDRAKRLVTKEEGLVDVEDGMVVDPAQLSEPATPKQLVEIEPREWSRSHECGRAVHDRASSGVDDRGIDDVARVGDTRLQDGPDTGVGPKRWDHVG